MLMSHVTKKFGENAGRLWTILNEKGCLKKDDILEVTKLNEKEFYSAVGWLARENKVSKYDNECFKLDNTNIGHEIGTHAGRVYKILDIWEDVDYDSIKRLSDLDDTQVHSALGWLAREDKIYTDERNRFKLK
jgi:hypothetical protein